MLHRFLNSLILLPDRLHYQTPGDLGLQAEAVRFPNAQGQMLHGWYVAPHEDLVPPTAAHPVVLFCPGTSGNLSSHLYYVELLSRAGCAVLALDYTGFGASRGEAWLTTLLPDVQSAVDYLRHTRQVRRLGIFGVSIGANVALLAAAQEPAIQAVAVEGLSLYRDIVYGILCHGVMGPRTLTSIQYNGQEQGLCKPHTLNPIRLGGWLARAMADIGLRAFPFEGKDPCGAAHRLAQVPVLCIHGVEDPLLPVEGTLRVYETLPGPKRLWPIPGVSHAQEPILAADGEYVAQLRAFFGSVWHGGDGHAPVTGAVVREAGSQYGIKLSHSGPPGLVLVSWFTTNSLAQQTLWVDREAYLAGVATGQKPAVSCLPLYESTGQGEQARPQKTPRGRDYHTTFRPLIRALSRALHERRFHELAPLLYSMPKDPPEAPFDFFLSLYGLQIMRRAQRKDKRLARAAAEIVQKYWHYGETVGEQATPRHLVADILA